MASQPRSHNLVSFRYDPKGILVRAKGGWYPTLAMDWVEGRLLHLYLRDTLERNGQLDNRLLCQAWVDVMQDLAQRRIAHGDLQHGNILVMPDGSISLVDYDGMFVPAMRERGLTAEEIGLAAYQHPKRYRGYFDERLDSFAALLILLSLACLDRLRWQRYHTDDNCLIVKKADLLRPEQSPLLAELISSSDAPVRKLAVLLKAAARASIDAIPTFDRVIADGTIKQLLSPSWRPTPSPSQLGSREPSLSPAQDLKSVLGVSHPSVRQAALIAMPAFARAISFASTAEEISQAYPQRISRRRGRFSQTRPIRYRRFSSRPLRRLRVYSAA